MDENGQRADMSEESMVWRIHVQLQLNIKHVLRGDFAKSSLSDLPDVTVSDCLETFLPYSPTAACQHPLHTPNQRQYQFQCHMGMCGLVCVFMGNHNTVAPCGRNGY